MTKVSLEAKLDEIKTIFLSSLPCQLAEIEILFERLTKQWCWEVCEKCLFELHSLKGSSATLGYTELSNIISICEARLKERVNSGLPPDAQFMAEVTISFEKLSQFKNTKLMISMENIPYNSEKERQDKPKLFHYNEVNIVLFSVKATPLSDLSNALSDFGFTTHFFDDLTKLKQLISQTLPHLVIFEFSQSKEQNSNIFEYATTLELLGIRCFLISSDNHIDMRLAAIRSGITEVILAPFCLSSLIAKIYRAVKFDVKQPLKVALVDDQLPVLKYFKSTMTEHGIEVKTALSAKSMLQELANFTPDIFIFDVFMPEINGIELAKVLRQIEKYDKTPIIFLSSEISLELKRETLEVGCDDLLPKDISPDDLVKQVTGRVNRVSTILGLAQSDPLTKLLSHAPIMKMALHQFEQATRNNSSMAIAILNIDNFKSINTDFGRKIADQVLLHLTQLLVARFGHSSFIGRYGGGEFMLVFPESALVDLKASLDDIRQSFGELAFGQPQNVFNVFFSAILVFKDNATTIEELISVANARLNILKSGGGSGIHAGTLQ
jgi:diguanylate cyclase (GGDEF)-like protein